MMYAICSCGWLCGRGSCPGIRLCSATVAAFPEYLARFLDPRALSAMYPYRADYGAVEIALDLALVAGITALALGQTRRRPWLLYR